MSVKGKKVVHCHGKKKGKVIKVHKTREKAFRQHRATMAKKAKDKK